MRHKIDSYLVAWHPIDKVGEIYLTYEDGGTQDLLNLHATDFTALLTVLQGEDQAWADDNGWIQSADVEVPSLKNKDKN